MKLALIIVLMLAVGTASAQELNVGLEFTGGPKANNSRILSMGPTIEYRFKESIMSFSSGVLFLFNKSEALLTFPLNIRFIIGNKFRVCPTAGVFIRSNKNYGWSLGLEIDYKIMERLFVFAKGDYNRDFYTSETPRHDEIYESDSSFWIGMGLKFCILYKSVPNKSSNLSGP